MRWTQIHVLGFPIRLFLAKTFGGTICHLFLLPLGPIWVRIVDFRGPRYSLPVLGGYLTRRVICPSDNFQCTSSLQFPDRIWERRCFASSVNTSEKCSPTQQYVFNDVFAKFILLITPASMTSLVMDYRPFSSRLSPIYSSLVAHLLISLSSSFPMILGFFFVRPVPLLEEELNCEVYYSGTCSSTYERRNNPNSHTTRANLGINLWGSVGPFALELRGVFCSPI